MNPAAQLSVPRWCAAAIGIVGIAACSSQNAELFRLRSDCATLSASVYERNQRDRSQQAFPKKVWDLQSRYEPATNRCYVAFRVADDISGEHVVYDAQTNELLAGGEVPLKGEGRGSGTVFLNDQKQKFQSFAEFEGWLLRFMKEK